MSAHAFLSPSAATRWLSCLSAPHREAVEPATTTKAAEQGTAAHELFESAMRDPAVRLKPSVGLTAKNGGEFTEEMARYIAKTRRAVREAYPGAKWLVEKQVPIWKAFGLSTASVWGTADLIGSTGDTLIVADLKYGLHSVAPKDNLQLSLYAIGAMHQTDWRFERIDLAILQPRTGKLFKRHSVSRGGLIALRDELRPKVQKVLAADAESKATPGNHCYFCKARKHCPEKLSAIAVNAFAEFL